MGSYRRWRGSSNSFDEGSLRRGKRQLQSQRAPMSFQLLPYNRKTYTLRVNRDCTVHRGPFVGHGSPLVRKFIDGGPEEGRQHGT